MQIGDKVKIKTLDKQKYIDSLVGWNDKMLLAQGASGVITAFSMGTFVVEALDGGFKWWLYKEDIEKEDSNV